MASAYFDNNVIVDIEEGLLNLNQVIQRTDPNIDTIFYSASHIQEAREIRGKKKMRTERINKRLQTLSSVTMNNYLYEELHSNQVVAMIEHPRTVLATITEVPWANWFIKFFVNLIGQDKRNKFRQSLNLKPSELNNCPPSEVLKQLNHKLESYKDGLSVMDIIEQGISDHTQGHTFGLSSRIAGVFEMLDLLGYWKDKHTKKSNYARLWDSSHTFFAAHTNYFISKDKRTRYKAEVVYKHFGIETIIIGL